MTHRHPLLTTTTLVLFAVALGAAQGAQVPPAEQVPVVEPQLSRLYGSDALSLGGLFVSGAVSPDRRWLVYSRGETSEGVPAGRMNLWIVPLGGSREAVRLTTGEYWDADPIWFPAGDRIAFRSTRADPSGNFQYLMTLEIDGASGRPTSVPRQVTLEPVPFTNLYRVSPDGEHLAYAVRPEQSGGPAGYVLKVIPAIGGTATTVWQQLESIYSVAWSDDGHLYFVGAIAAGDDAAVRLGINVKRVPATGGEAETLSTRLGISKAVLSSNAEHVLYEVTPRPSEEVVVEIASVHGKGLASFSLPVNMSLSSCFAGQRLECLATTEELSAPLQVVPARGGPARQVGKTGEYDQPLGWTSDGREVVVKGEFDGFPAITAVPAGGGAKRLLHRLDAEEKWAYGPYVLDARYVLYGVAGESADTAVLRILDLETGVEREITRTAWAGYTRYNPSRTSDRFLYAERQNGRFEFRAVDPNGESILLRAFSDSAFPPIIGVHGDRIAYWVASEEESTLFLAEAGEDAVREVMTFPGSVGQRGGSPPVWSPDGRLLASEYRRRGVPEQFAFVVEIDPYGSAVGEPKIMEDVSPSWWGLTWLPTSDAYLIVDGDAWLVPLDSSKSALKLTGAASGPTWWLELSPDGGQVAVAPEVHSGGSIWRLDLEEILARLK